MSPPCHVASKGKDEEGLPLFVAFVLRGGGEGNNPPQSRRGRTSRKEEGRGGTLPIGVMLKEKDEEGVDPSLFASKHVENRWGGVIPSLFASKHTKNRWGGVGPSPFVSNCIENKVGRGIEPPPYTTLK